jgi:hypothetical protein
MYSLFGLKYVSFCSDFARNAPLGPYGDAPGKQRLHLESANAPWIAYYNRMPVILRQRDYARWLAPGDPSHLPIDLLRPFPADEMKAWKVGPDLGNARNNRPELVEQIE